MRALSIHSHAPHPLTRLDARLKLLAALALLLLVISYGGVAFPLLMAALGSAG